MSLGLRGARPDLQFKATKRRREEKSFSDEERAKQQVLGYAIPNKDFLPTDIWTTKNLPSSSLDVHFTKYRPLNGSSYIELPKFIESKKAVVNIKHADDQCFKWCITRARNPVEKTLKE